MKDGQDGATLLDAIVGIAIVCIVVPAVILLSHGTGNAVSTAKRLARFDHSLLQADRLLRSQLERISMPPELVTLPVRVRADGIRVYYLGGKPTSYLEVRVSEGPSGRSKILQFSDSESTMKRIVRFKEADLRVSIDPRRPIVQIEIEANGSIHATILAAPGAWPLRGRAIE